MPSLRLLTILVTTLGGLQCHCPEPMDTKQLTNEVERLRSKLDDLLVDNGRLSQGLQHLSESVQKLTERVGKATQTLEGLTEKVDKLSEGAVQDKTELAKEIGEVDGRLTGRINRLNETFCEPPECSSAAAMKPTTCEEARKHDKADGVHTLHVLGRDITAYCDQTTDGGGWTVIQRRQNGDLDFYRGWDSYLTGFGFPHEEFWLGLESIYHLTSSTIYTLRVDLWDFEGNTAYAQYRVFYIEGADRNYRLHVSGYSGTAGDSLHEYHNNQAFSTYDRDNDAHGSANCAVSAHGAFWYKNCNRANPNGRYEKTPQTGWDRVIWHSWKGQTSLKKTEMKIRPAA